MELGTSLFLIAVGAILTFFELMPLLAWLGRVFERTDPGSVPAG